MLLHIYPAQSYQVCRACCKPSTSRSSLGTRPQALHQPLEEDGAAKSPAKSPFPCTIQ